MNQGQPAAAEPAPKPSFSKTLVISGVGMNEGGILTVLRDFTAAAERTLSSEWRIVVLAHKKELMNCARAEVMEYPTIKSSWFRRIGFELFTSRRLAKELGATVWFAMHDITPLVDTERQYVYCHNPTPFTRPTFRSLRFDRIFVIHSLLYRYIYSLNIKRNTKVFVQQKWIRERFLRDFGARDVVVSRPAKNGKNAGGGVRAAAIRKPSLKRWIYPTFPRHFKNVEVVGLALELLEKNPEWSGEVVVTIDGSENTYAKWLCERFGHLRSLKLIGRQTAAQMARLYSAADGLIFPSKLETWGLPITESQERGLPLLVADLEYAYETVGHYDAVTFFDPNDPAALAKLLLDLSTGQARMGSTESVEIRDDFVVTGWDNLVHEVCN